MCLNNKELMENYIKVCDAIDNQKKEEISKNLLQQEV